jgi:glycine betaine transporter
MAVWGALMGALAVVLLVTGGNNAMLNIQTISLCSAPPFAIIMFFSCLGFWKALKSDEAGGRLTV